MTSHDELIAKIEAEYEAKRNRALHERDMRMQSIYQKIPRLGQINRLLADSVYRIFKESGFGSDADAATEKVARENEALKAEKIRLLAENGLSEKDLEPWYECGTCQDTGFIKTNRLSEFGAPVWEPCACRKKRLAMEAHQNSSLVEQLKKANFSTYNINVFSPVPFNTEHVSARAAAVDNLNMAKAYVESFSGDRMQNLLFYGAPGTGKTFLCSSIAGAIMDKGFSVLYLTAHEVASLFDNIRFHRDQMTAAERTSADLIKEADLLIIDDLGSEFVTSSTVAEIFNCVNDRLLHEKSLIISTNLYLKQLGKTYGERFVSRLIGNFEMVEFYGADLRIPQ